MEKQRERIMKFIEEQRKDEESKEAAKQQPQMSTEETQKFVNDILAKQRYA